MLYVKQLTALGVFMTLVGISPANEDYMPATKSRLAETIVAPHVSSESKVPFLDYTRCKVTDSKKPVLEQLEECKKQRIGWLKI